MITYDSPNGLTQPLMIGTAKYTYPIPDNYDVYLLHQDFVVRAEYFTDPVLGSTLPNNGGGHLSQQTNVKTLKGGLIKYTNIYAFNFNNYKKVTEQSESVSFPAFKADHFVYKEHYRLDWKPFRRPVTRRINGIERTVLGGYEEREPRTLSEYRGGKDMTFREAFSLLVPVEVTETIETNSTSKGSTSGEIGDLPDHEVPKDNPNISPELLARMKAEQERLDAKYKFGEPMPNSAYNPLREKFQVFLDLEKQLSIKLEQYSEENKVTAENWKNEKGIQLKTDLSPDLTKEALGTYGRNGYLEPANFSAYVNYIITPDFVRYIGTDMTEMISKFGIGVVKVNYVSTLTNPTFDAYKAKIGRKEMVPFPETRTQLFGDLYLVKRFRCEFR